MGNTFSIILFFVGMTTCNTILVLPRYSSNETDFKGLAILNEVTSILSNLLFLLMLAVEFGGPLRLLYMVLWPTDGSITLPMVMLGPVSLLLHIPLLFLIFKGEPGSLKSRHFFCTITLIWSIVAVIFIILLKVGIFTGSALIYITSAACFAFSICVVGQLFLFLISKATELFSKIKGSKLSLSNVKKQIIIFAILYIVTFTINMIAIIKS